jgi:nucleoid DNA-binding protein
VADDANSLRNFLYSFHNGKLFVRLFPKKNQWGVFQMATKTAVKTAAAKGAKPAPKTKSSTARKASAVAKAAEKPQTEVSPMPEETEETLVKVATQMKVKDLIERVAAATDLNKKDVRAIVDATLAELGKALEANESLNLPPFGRLRIANQKSDASGQMMTLKLRRGGEKHSAKEALAEPGEDS